MENGKWKIKNWVAVISVVILVAISSCKKDSVIAPYSLSYNYVPTDTGRWIIYDVDSTVYDNFSNPSVITNYTYQVIERIDSTFTDNQGRPTQRLQRARRDSATAPWNNYLIIWTSTLTNSRFEKVEENNRYLKLAFPITESQSWNGNAFNTLGFREYYYEAIHVPMTIDSFNFDSVLVVFQGLAGIVTEEKNGREIYASNVGMVKREFNDLVYNPINPNNTGGFTYTYTVNQYGAHNAPMPIND